MLFPLKQTTYHMKTYLMSQKKSLLNLYTTHPTKNCSIPRIKCCSNRTTEYETILIRLNKPGKTALIVKSRAFKNYKYPSNEENANLFPQ